MAISINTTFKASKFEVEASDGTSDVKSHIFKQALWTIKNADGTVFETGPGIYDPSTGLVHYSNTKAFTPEATYKIQVVYEAIDAKPGTSAEVSFTVGASTPVVTFVIETPTITIDTPTTTLNIGDAYEGGYYAGKIVENGVTYNLVLAPKTGGETIIPGTSAILPGTGPLDELDGYSVTTTAITADTTNTYAAVTFVKSVRSAMLGGHNDWYMPSLKEMELLYRNFKPTIRDNDLTSPLAMGNSYTVPVGEAYTATIPGQTTVVAFQENGTQAFAALVSGLELPYATASRGSTMNHYLIKFGNGQNASNTELNLRLVRRVPVV